jgi:hypothetical protein
VAVKEALENPIELLMDNNPTKALEMESTHFDLIYIEILSF